MRTQCIYGNWILFAPLIVCFPLMTFLKNSINLLLNTNMTADGHFAFYHATNIGLQGDAETIYFIPFISQRFCFSLLWLHYKLFSSNPTRFSTFSFINLSFPGLLQIFIMRSAEIHNPLESNTRTNLHYLTRNIQFRLTHLIFCSFDRAGKVFWTQPIIGKFLYCAFDAFLILN